MDLQSATRTNGKRWQVARIGALLCFGLASGLLVLSLAAPSLAEHGARTAPGSAEFTAAR